MIGVTTKTGSAPAALNLRGRVSITVLRGGIEIFPGRTRNFQRQPLPEPRRAARRHRVARDPITVAARPQFGGRVGEAFDIRRREEIRRPAKVRELFSEKRQVRNEIAPGEPEPD